MDEPCYEYRAFWSTEDDAWVGLCDGFDLVSHLAPTEAEALDGIRSVVSDIVDDLRSDGEPLPRAVRWEEREAAHLAGPAVRSN
ncbi:MAG: antitoxin HicB [bacterium]|nr:antitoxin HicB [bacterium]